MFLTIENQFDEISIEYFLHRDGGKNLVVDSLFCLGVDGLILSDQAVAIGVLREIELGRVDIFRQERVALWIYRLFHLLKRKNFPDLKDAFYSAMKALVEKTDSRFIERGYKNNLDPIKASEYYGFGGNAALISYGIRNARYIANREVFKHLGSVFGEFHPAHLIDRPGRTQLIIKCPRDAAYSKFYEGCYEGGGRIVGNGGDQWVFSFDDHIDSKVEEFKSMTSLWSSVFLAVCPIFSELLDSEVVIEFKWDFED